MIAAASLGSAGAIFAVPRLLRRLSIGRIAALGFVAQVTGLVLQGVALTLPTALGGALLVGVGFSLSFTQMTAMLQLGSPDELRGRVMAIHTLSHLGMRPVWALTVGSAATLAGGRVAILLFLVLVPIGLLGARLASRREDLDAGERLETAPAA
jgi:hypothetical protein